MSAPHVFRTSLRRGEQWELVLDQHFAALFTITPVSMTEQRMGIDRWFTGPDGQRFSVEYKTDERADSTGNFFIEFLSVDTAGKLGWAYSCQSDFLVLFIPERAVAYILRPKDVLRETRDTWIPNHRIKSARNDGYNTVGVCVPIDVVAVLAVRTVKVDKSVYADLGVA